MLRSNRCSNSGYFGGVNPGKSPFELAALATAALPGLRVTEVRSPQFDDEFASGTVVVDAGGDAWSVRASKIPSTESAVLRNRGVTEFLCERSAAGVLPFRVPKIVGVAATAPDLFATVSTFVGGHPLNENELYSAGLLPASLGRAFAALHQIRPEHLSVFSPQVVTSSQTRSQWSTLLEQIGHQIPGRLRKRWNVALDEDTLWTYTPRVVHGDLRAENILVNEGAVWALTDFSSLRVDDPAVDVAWLVPMAGDEFMREFFAAYSDRIETPDLHLLTRAQLYSELAVAEWLQFGLQTNDSTVVSEATAMIADLDADLAGSMLVASSRPVKEIHFTLEEEPLNRVWRGGQDAAADSREERPHTALPAGGEPGSTGVPIVDLPESPIFGEPALEDATLTEVLDPSGNSDR